MPSIFVAPTSSSLNSRAAMHTVASLTIYTSFRLLSPVDHHVHQQAVNEDADAGVQSDVEAAEHDGGNSGNKEIDDQKNDANAYIAVLFMNELDGYVQSARRAVVAEHKSQPHGGEQAAEQRG